MTISDLVLTRLEAALGPKGATRDPAEIAPHIKEWRDLYRGNTPLLLKPATTEEVSAVVKICAETGAPIVPARRQHRTCRRADSQRRGFAFALAPEPNPAHRCRRQHDHRRAGVVLADIHRAAADADRLYPLSLASEGSAQIGGPPLDQRRRHQCAALRHGRRARPRPRSGAAGWPRALRLEASAQRQYRLPFAPAVSRRRRNARHHHRRGVETVAMPARDSDRNGGAHRTRRARAAAQSYASGIGRLGDRFPSWCRVSASSSSHVTHRAHAIHSQRNMIGMR